MNILNLIVACFVFNEKVVHIRGMQSFVHFVDNSRSQAQNFDQH